MRASTNGSGARSRAVVIDDCPLLRHGVAAVLAERGFTVAGETASVADGLATVRIGAVDLVVLGLPSSPAAPELVERSRAAAASLCVVVLVPRLEAEVLRRLLTAGPDVVLTRNASVAEVGDALDRSRDGERVVAPAHLATLLGALAPGDPVASPLTEREMVVLSHLANGRSNRDIAEAMVVSVATVKTHLSHIYAKLEVSGRAEAVAKGIALRLLV